jgi:hypothetical protein
MRKLLPMSVIFASTAFGGLVMRLTSVAPNGPNFRYSYEITLSSGDTLKPCGTCSFPSAADSAIWFDFPGYVLGSVSGDGCLSFSTQGRPALLPSGHVPCVSVGELFRNRSPVTGPFTFHVTLDSIYPSKQKSFISQDLNQAGQLVQQSGSILGPDSAAR